MSRFRLYPTPAQEAVLQRHCADARFVWNLGLEQRLMYRPGRGPTPGLAEQCRQLTEARRAEAWLAEGSTNVQQQALRDLDRAWCNFFAGAHGRPGWRKAGRNEGFRIVGYRTGSKALWGVRRISRHWGEVRIPHAGWVRLRWSRPVPEEAKSYRVTLDNSGRWHVSFAMWPAPTISGPRNGEVVGIDRGVAVTLTMSDGTTLQAPKERPVARLQRKFNRAKRGSNRRAKLKVKLNRLHARNADARKDWMEKASTDIARRYDLIRIEDLKVQHLTRSARGSVERPGRNVRQKAGLNRSIRTSCWAQFATRLEQKAPGRVEKVKPHYTSQRCSACGHVDAKSRKSQADFVCTACGFACNADVNAAINIAAGYAVTARGGSQLGPLNREPQAA